MVAVELQFDLRIKNLYISGFDKRNNQVNGSDFDKCLKFFNFKYRSQFILIIIF